MKWVETLKKDKKKFDSLTDNNSRIAFLWDYYKIRIGLLLLVIILVLYSIGNALVKKPVILYAVLLNSDGQAVETDSTVFLEKLALEGIDTDKKEVDVNDYLTLGVQHREEEDGTTLQVLNALFAMNDLDLFVGSRDNFDLFIEKDAFCDLSLYIDETILNQHEEMLYRYEDSSGNEIVGGVFLKDGSPLHRAGYYHHEVVMGVTNGGYNMENAIAFVKQCLLD